MLGLIEPAMEHLSQQDESTTLDELTRCGVAPVSGVGVISLKGSITQSRVLPHR